jgi:hypothetical protein
MDLPIFEVIYTFIKQERAKKKDDDLIFMALKNTVKLPNIDTFLFMVDELIYLEN